MRIRVEMNALTLHVCAALSDVRDADGLEGFGMWVKSSGKGLGANSRDFKTTWIHGLCLQTKGLYEEALELYFETLGVRRQAHTLGVHALQPETDSLEQTASAAGGQWSLNIAFIAP